MFTKTYVADAIIIHNGRYVAAGSKSVEVSIFCSAFKALVKMPDKCQSDESFINFRRVR